MGISKGGRRGGAWRAHSAPSPAPSQVLGTPLWGWLTDVTAPRPVFNLCLGFSVVAVTLFGLAQRFWWACALRFLGGLVDGVNLVLITFMADVMRRAEKSGSAIVVTISQICGIGIGLRGGGPKGCGGGGGRGR